ncbi:MAG: very short patch repair endonuclease [candidate division Zixibacteria bacterium]|nr:very short patch repair endonuclease [candidate division Zixibacteria bacterium]
MGRVRPKNSKIEQTVFTYLRKRQVHFQRHYKRVVGTPDIARPSEKKAVFIHSDFWHGWRFPAWEHRLSSDFWRDKIQTNRARDARVVRKLRRLGWRVLVVWEHQLKRDPDRYLIGVETFLRD